jgi:uncharacterized protein (TIGR00369 family)
MRVSGAGAPLPDAEHFRRLERLYASAPVTQWFGTRIQVGDGEAEVWLTVRPEFFHAAHAVHGSVYFRLLDDAAFFAANSRVREVFVLTVSFTVQFARPVAAGEVRARGRVRHGGGRLVLADSDLFDAGDQLLAHGTGVFTRSAIPLDEKVGHR